LNYSDWLSQPLMPSLKLVRNGGVVAAFRAFSLLALVPYHQLGAETQTRRRIGPLLSLYGPLDTTMTQSERAPLLSTLDTHSSYNTCANSTSRQQLYSQLAISSGSFKIRLLDLQAAPPGQSPDAPLIGHLRVVHLADGPEFTSLSYVWGNTSEEASSRPFQLTILSPEHVNLDITENLHHALRQIRRHKGTVTIWVDAVCINQDDDCDKETQIPLMEKIYSMARVGYVWLGKSSPGLDFAVKCVMSRASISRRLPLGCISASMSREDDHTREWWRLEWRKCKDVFGKRHANPKVREMLNFG